MTVDYIDGHREEFGVEPICTVLEITPSTYYAAKTRAPSARATRDAVLKVTLLVLWKANYEVYGIQKLWKAALRAGEHVGRDQVARLMREVGIAGARNASAPPELTSRRPGTRTSSIAGSSRQDPTRCGSPT